jgi:hypothetical protein
MTHIAEACDISSSIPINELSLTFGIPLTLQVEQSTNIMEAWLLKYQVGQKYLANIIKQECCSQGKFTKNSLYPVPVIATLINHWVKLTACFYLTYNSIQATAQVKLKKPCRPALLQRTLNFNL